MRRLVLVMGVISMTLATPLTTTAHAQALRKDQADDHKPSFPIEAEAVAFVSKFDRTELSKDDVFARVLVLQR